MSQKYDEIKAFLKAEALKPESRVRMPTIAELMQRFRASQSPVSRAVHDLEREGVLYCRRGAGIVSRSGSAPVHRETAGRGEAPRPRSLSSASIISPTRSGRWNIH